MTYGIKTESIFRHFSKILNFEIIYSTEQVTNLQFLIKFFEVFFIFLLINKVVSENVFIVIWKWHKFRKPDWNWFANFTRETAIKTRTSLTIRHTYAFQAIKSLLPTAMWVWYVIKMWAKVIEKTHWLCH